MTCMIERRRVVNYALPDSSVVSILFRRTSEVQLALFERVQVRERIVNEVGR
jgi:hypothetical protein